MKKIRNVLILGARFKSNYSKTLLLPQTKFGPKIPQGEQAETLLEKTSEELYNWQLINNANRSKFILHDGPPYANGDLHVGHSLNKIIKDIINRFQLIYHNKLIQYKVGWDCHGLPIEIKVENLLSKDATDVEIRRKCKEWANTMIEKQKEQFKKFNIMTNFNDPYITMYHDYEIKQLKIFKKLMENGLLSQQLKPVWWGCDTQTALAEAELEYNDKHKSIAIYVKFPIISNGIYDYLSNKSINIENGKLNVLIWTSTPWTIPANKAVCVNKNLIYTLIHKDDEYLIVARSLAPEVLKLDESYTQIDIEIPGSSLTNNTYIDPTSLDNDPRRILHGDHVIETAGTGLVHNAPSHGKEDYLIGRVNNLEIDSIVDNQGRYIDSELPSGFKSLGGFKVTESKTNMLVVNLLMETNQIFNLNKKFIHSYPYDWRSKTPVIQRSTPQWFVNVEKVKPFVKEALSKVRFYPDLGINRLSSFIENRNEWCVSRQRCWGVPLPIVYKKSDDSPITDLKVIDYIVNKIDQYGTDEWFTEEENISRWLPFDGSDYYKGKDTMDVWFDSGTSWSTLNENLQDCNIADVYLEGSDQHRGWFQSSLLNKIIFSGENGSNFKPIAPFKSIITHGFIIDGKGQKMSKSKGNVFSPIEVIEGCKKPVTPYLGSDGLRLWAASSNFKQDVTFNIDILKRTSEMHKKYRITFRYLLGNLNNFNFKNPVPYHELSDLDKYILHTLVDLQNSCTENYETYNFARIINSVNLHLNSILSAIYFDVSKDCLYTDSEDSLRRRSIQTVLNEILKTYIGILSPIQPLLTQEVWNEYQDIVDLKIDSPFKMKWNEFYALPEFFENQELSNKFDEFFQLRDQIFKQVEHLKNENYFKNKLELEIEVTSIPDTNIYKFLIANQNYLDDLLLVSKVNIIKGDRESIKIQHSTDYKCPRCWKFTSTIDGTICSKCSNVIK
ncbi:unnamed protein product [Candida verbasci]|uniref:isoleucine--tRNA ligase n=1 Tax=Candida verbasci TaxID=1227364 RepID=A0A9W4XEV1_9ASCO|nr:unnamed protein product [Candida verbasci]